MGIYTDLIKRLSEKDHIAMATVLEDGIKKYIVDESSDESIAEMSNRAFTLGKPVVKKEFAKTTVIEPFSGLERMIVLGGGHVSLALCEFAKKLGFYVIVVDDRSFFANTERFPFADEVICDEFTSAIEKLAIHSGDYVVLVTRGHKYDGDCLRAISNGKKPYYTGMIGSKRRVAELKSALIGEGISKEWLDSVCSPIGLAIGAITPEEIGVSILAQIIQFRRNPENNMIKALRSDIDFRVVEHLSDAESKGLKKAVITVIDGKGSTPRKPGAKMVVYEDGSISGTIGGGCSESDIMRVARRMLAEGQGYQVVDVDLTGDIAEEEGMVCGGIMTMLVEVG